MNDHELVKYGHEINENLFEKHPQCDCHQNL